MKNFRIYFFLYVNSVATVVAYYRKCNASFSLCLITNNTEDRSYLNNKFLLTRSSAEIWCRNRSSTLASITNETVQSAIEAFANDPSAKLMNSYVLTNGYRLNLSYWEWVNGKQSDNYVEAIVPAFHHITHRYVYLLVSTNKFTLFDSHANYKRKFICSYVAQISGSRCLHGSRHFEGRCYKFHNRTATWFDARNICLRDGRDLAIFENGIPRFPPEWTEQQIWIGMRKETWHWRNGPEIKYSNWDALSPSSSGGDCLCVQTWTDDYGEWTTCGCSWNYRYICIQDYASHSTSTVKTSSIQRTQEKIQVTTPTTQMITTAMSTRTTELKTLQSTTTSTPTLGDSSSEFHSTSIHTLDDDLRSNDIVSDDPLNKLIHGSGQSSDFLPFLGIGIACLLILIIVIVAVVIIRNRRSRSDEREPTHGNSSPPMTYKDDAPSTVYAAVIPNTNDQVYSASEKNSNQTVYAELDLESKRSTGPTQRVSVKVRFTSEETPSQAIYAEVNQVPKENMNEKAEGPSVYDNYNALMMDSVYANSAQTKV